MALPDAHNIQKCVILIVFMLFIFSLCTILTVPFNCLKKHHNTKINKKILKKL